MTVPCRRDEPPATIAARFHGLHERVYGHSAPEEPVEIVTARIVAGGRFERATVSTASSGSTREPETRDVRFTGETQRRSAAVVQRASLRADDILPGPAVVEQLDATTLIPPGWMARALPAGSLLVEAGR